jgi:hypothetical protein
MGVSRKCVKTWIDRYDAEGEAGLHDRSSRPHSTPGRTSSEVEARVVELRRRERRGPDWISAEVGVPTRTVSRILSRHQVPPLAICDPMTGEVIRASKATAVSYERDRPGELVHMDVKKLARIPDGGGWRGHGGTVTNHPSRPDRGSVGFDYVHSLVDDHSRLAYSEVLPDEKGPTCAGFLTRAAAYFAAHGITQIDTDHDRQRLGLPLVAARSRRRARRPAEVHQAVLPVAEREGRAAQPHPADRVGLPTALREQRPAIRRPCALARALQHSTPPQRTRREATSQPPATNLMAGYT